MYRNLSYSRLLLLAALAVQSYLIGWQIPNLVRARDQAPAIEWKEQDFTRLTLHAERIVVPNVADQRGGLLRSVSATRSKGGQIEIFRLLWKSEAALAEVKQALRESEDLVDVTVKGYEVHDAVHAGIVVTGVTLNEPPLSRDENGEIVRPKINPAKREAK